MPSIGDMPQYLLDLLEAKRMADYVQCLDVTGLARLAGALQAECSARRIRAAIPALGQAQAALEDWAREQVTP